MIREKRGKDEMLEKFEEKYNIQSRNEATSMSTEV
jgi:hypothetical protein